MAKLIDFKQFADNRGSLVAVEGLLDIPFEIKRVFYVSGVSPGSTRGNHANRNSEFVLIALAGSCTVQVDDGHQVLTKRLDKPSEGLYIPKMIWKTMSNFSSDCILLILASEHYNPEEFVSVHDDFLAEVRADV